MTKGQLIVPVICPAWGEPGCPLVPRAFRIGWADLRVPASLEEALGVAPVYWADLGPEMWARTSSDSGRIREAVVEAVKMTSHGAWAKVADLPVVGLESPGSLDLRQLPFRIRTLNALLEGTRLAADVTSSLTVERFARFRNVGMVSILDYGCTAESGLIAITKDQSHAIVPSLEELRARYRNEPWALRISSRDPRFSHLLKGHLDVPLLSLSNPSQTKVAAVALALERARPVAEAIERSGLKTQLADYVNALAEARQSPAMSAALVARLGLGGRPPCTLQDAAEMVGVTRERVRQVEVKYLKRQRRAHPRPFMPALERAIERLAVWAPTPVAAAVQRLTTEGIGVHHFSVESIMCAANFLGFDVPFEMLKTEGSALVIRLDKNPKAREGLRRAVLKIGSLARRGIASAQEVQTELDEQGHELTIDQIRAAITAVPGVRSQGDWFWDLTSGDNGRNRIVNLTCKMLTLNSPLPLSTLREGLRRHDKYRGRVIAPPPLAVLETFYDSRPEFVVDEAHHVSTLIDVSSGTYTSAVEEAMVAILRRAPNSLMDRNTFVEACHKAGIDLNTVNMYTSYNPCLERVAPNVWAPRGTDVSPVVLDEFRREHGWRNSPNNDVETGWDNDGRPWWTFRVTGTLLSAGGASTVPAAIRPILGRDYECFADTGQSCGVIHANGDSVFVWGWAPFMSLAGVDIGDYIRTRFDIAKRRAWCEVGGSELLEDRITAVT